MSYHRDAVSFLVKFAKKRHDAFAGLYGLPGACSTVAKIRITGGRYGIYGSVSDKMIGGVQPGVNDQLLIGITLENQLENMKL